MTDHPPSTYTVIKYDNAIEQGDSSFIVPLGSWDYHHGTPDEPFARNISGVSQEISAGEFPAFRNTCLKQSEGIPRAKIDILKRGWFGGWVNSGHTHYFRGSKWSGKPGFTHEITEDGSGYLEGELLTELGGSRRVQTEQKPIFACELFHQKVCGAISLLMPNVVTVTDFGDGVPLPPPSVTSSGDSALQADRSSNTSPCGIRAWGEQLMQSE